MEIDLVARLFTAVVSLGAVFWLISPIFSQAKDRFSIEPEKAEPALSGAFYHEIEHEYAIGSIDEADYKALTLQKPPSSDDDK